MLSFFGYELSDGIGDINVISMLLFIAAIAALRKFKINPTLVILGCGVLGGVVFSFF
jgi:chromate transporter